MLVLGASAALLALIFGTIMPRTLTYSRMLAGNGSSLRKPTSASMLGSEAIILLDPKLKKSKHKGSVNHTTSTSALQNSSSVKFEVSMQFNTTKADAPPSSSAKSHGDKQLFYLYELPEKFWWRWPENGTDCSGNGYVGHEHAQYSGIGPPIRPEDGLFLTWHFSLFSSLYNRIKRSSRRTMDPEKASLFIIPYDIGLDGYLDPKSCNNRRQCTPGFVGELMNILNKMPYFTRNKGADHAVLWSLGQYHPWPRAGCDVFMKDTCLLCTFTCYWMDPTKGENKFVSVPFPSGYHYHDDIKHLPWSLENSNKRNLTAVYLGSTQTLNPHHTKIRRAMTAQCNQSKECHWLQIAHNSKDHNIADFLSVYKRATFCLCPPGDDPARKAVFDAIISGCIPVIFEVATLYNQYPWHIGEQAALDISISIPGGKVKSGQLDFMSILLAISPEVIKKKQIALSKIAPRVQYAIPPYSSLIDKYSSGVWDPPFQDGVEILLNGFFDRRNKLMKNVSTNIPPRLMSGREWSHEYDVVRVQVPQDNTKYYSDQEINDNFFQNHFVEALTFADGTSSSGSSSNAKGDIDNGNNDKTNKQQKISDTRGNNNMNTSTVIESNNTKDESNNELQKQQDKEIASHAKSFQNPSASTGNNHNHMRSGINSHHQHQHHRQQHHKASNVNNNNNNNNNGGGSDGGRKQHHNNNHHPILLPPGEEENEKLMAQQQSGGGRR